MEAVGELLVPFSSKSILINGDKLEISTTSGLSKDLLIKATSIGLQTAYKNVSVRICGLEEVTEVKER